MPPPQLLRSGLAGLRDRLRRDAGFRGSVRMFGACARSRSSFRLLGDVIVHFAPTGHAFVKVVPFGLRRSFCETCCGLPGTRGGYALSARAAHFLATSAVAADVSPFMH